MLHPSHHKWDEAGNIMRHNVCFIAKGYEQIYGQDFTQTTAPTARLESFHVLLHIATAHDWDAQQFDIKTAFCYESDPISFSLFPFLSVSFRIYTYMDRSLQPSSM